MEPSAAVLTIYLIAPDMVSRIIYKNKNKFFFKNAHELIDTISVEKSLSVTAARHRQAAGATI